MLPEAYSVCLNRQERDNLERALQDIEALGENFEWYGRGAAGVLITPQVPGCQLTSSSPDDRCNSKVCSNSCFARSCFDWCLMHKHPSVEGRDGTITVEMHFYTKGEKGDLVPRIVGEQQRVCGHKNARRFPGNCRIVTSSFTGREGEAAMSARSGIS